MSSESSHRHIAPLHQGYHWSVEEGGCVSCIRLVSKIAVMWKVPLGLVLLGVVLVVSSCSIQTGILDAEASGDGKTLTLSMRACHGNYEVEVDERRDRVTVNATDQRSPIRFSGDDCSDQLTVGLAEPIGGRHVVDGSNGAFVHVTYEPWNQTRYSEAEYRVALQSAAECILEEDPGSGARVVERDDVPYLEYELPDLPDGATETASHASVACVREHVEPLRQGNY